MAKPFAKSHEPADVSHGGPLLRTRFSVADLPAHRRVDAYRGYLDRVQEVDIAAERLAAPDPLVSEAYCVGPVLLNTSHGPEAEWRRTRANIATGASDHFVVRLMTGGRAGLVGDRRELVASPGDIYFLDFAQPFRATATGFGNISISIPRHLVLSLMPEAEAFHLRKFQNDIPFVHLLKDNLVSLNGLAEKMCRRDGESFGPILTGLVSSCLSGLDLEMAAEDVRTAIPLKTAIKTYMNDNLSRSSLSTEDICARFNLSRSTLYRLFKGDGGAATVLRELRLNRAYRVLSDARQADRLIYDIALEAGFSSDTAFSRAFRQAFGLSPQDLRRTGGRPTSREPGTDEGVLSMAEILSHCR